MTRMRMASVWLGAMVVACGGGGGGDGASSESGASSSETTNPYIDPDDYSGSSNGDPASTTPGEESGTSPMPGCGDGVIAGDEQCDDGNAVDGDGCNADCTAAGTTLWRATWDGPLQYDGVDDLVVDSSSRVQFLATSSDGDGTAVYWRGWIEADGELVASEDTAPDDAWAIELGSDDVTVLVGHAGEADAPLVRAYGPDGTLLWELVDDAEPGGYATAVTSLDDGELAFVGVNAAGDAYVGHVSADGGLLSSAPLSEGSFRTLERAGDQLVGCGFDDALGYWLGGIELSGMVAWSDTNGGGGFELDVTPDDEIVVYRGDLQRLSSTGQLLDARPVEQAWWSAPIVTVDPSGDILLAGDYFDQLGPFGQCQVARLGPDLAQKWVRLLDDTIGCTALVTAPDGTLIVGGDAVVDEYIGDSVGFVARIAP